MYVNNDSPLWTDSSETAGTAGVQSKRKLDRNTRIFRMLRRNIWYHKAGEQLSPLPNANCTNQPRPKDQKKTRM